ncbi:MAG: cytochrome c oxidase subunit II [Candidatus Azambacteria bacterium GW2011_GWF2_46_32]|uniref:Cytochrome c oxidase subunit II n=1 Tax=Candidatus Azambacteria bacterium GW2011_GWF2_46_32 TaxID=1618628 RepID=A0A0G1ST42_9BACT|nr:MAG: cytochrome c oxidase subunit II [Candidatus Azambacteria bacterium GW2011_GWF2_46_32]
MAAVIIAAVWYGAAPSLAPEAPLAPVEEAPVVEIPEGETSAPAVPEGVTVPTVGETEAPEGVAVPTVVAPAAPGVSAQFRSFDVKAQNDAFSPNEIRVNQGDTVHINFAAIGKTYDILIPDYGLKQTAKAGESKVIEFQALNPGTYAFYCELCGGLQSKTKGVILVVPTK